jgi:hypothetical protein
MARSATRWPFDADQPPPPVQRGALTTRLLLPEDLDGLEELEELDLAAAATAAASRAAAAARSARSRAASRAAATSCAFFQAR